MLYYINHPMAISFWEDSEARPRREPRMGGFIIPVESKRFECDCGKCLSCQAYMSIHKMVIEEAMRKCH